MCNLMHRGGLDNILQLTLNIFFFKYIFNKIAIQGTPQMAVD